MIVPSVLIAFLATAAPATSGWLSDLVENGRLPPIEDIALCTISPNLCVLNEGQKEVVRQQQIERQKEEYKNALIEDRKQIKNTIDQLQIANDKERTEVNAALADGDRCLLNSKNLGDSDDCYLKVQTAIRAIHRKYQAGPG
jgi:hypothetical protein